MGNQNSVLGFQPAPIITTVTLMSVYHPFPLRIDSSGTGSLVQYDACLQIGEFKTMERPSDPIVVFIPLMKTDRPEESATFVNAFGSKIPNILGAQPDINTGYPDVPAATGADWSISKVLKTDRSYYTWTNKDGTRVIVMAEPVFISEPDLLNIQRLPITPPEDVIHEIGTNVQYKAAPPVDSRGNPVPCPKSAAAAAMDRISQPPIPPSVNKPAVDTNMWLQTILGIIGTIAIIIGIWFGLKLASGPVGEMLKNIGDSLGSSLAGGYGALRRARSGTANVLGIGQNRPLPAPRTAAQIAQTPAPAATPAAVAEAPAPTSFQVTNPGYTSLENFARRQRTMRNPVKLRTPAALGDISPAFIPEPTGNFPMTTNPGFKNKSDFARLHATRRAYPKVKSQDKVVLPTPPSADEIARRAAAEKNRQAQPAGTGLFDLGIPSDGEEEELKQILKENEKAKQAEEETKKKIEKETEKIHKMNQMIHAAKDRGAKEGHIRNLETARDAIERSTNVMKAASPPRPPTRSSIAPHRRGVFVPPPPLPSIASVASATEPFPDAPAAPVRRRRTIAPEPDDFIPPPPVPPTPTAATRFMRELDEAAPVDPLSLGEHATLDNLSRTEETPEERIARRARETALPRPPGMPTAPRRTGADTGLFGSPAMRAATGVREKTDRAPGANATIFGGKRKRRHRLKTGRAYS